MTITEFMIALLISLIIMAAMVQIFVRSRGTYTYQQDLSNSQEGARIASDLITRDIRMSGYFGCRNFPPGSNFKLNSDVVGSYAYTIPTGPTGPGGFPLDERAGLVGFRYIGNGGTSPATDWSPPLPGALFTGLDSLRPYSDVLLVRYANSSGIAPLANIDWQNPSPIRLPLAYRDNFSNGDVVTIADCKRGDIFRIQAVTVTGTEVQLTPTNATLESENTYDRDSTEFFNFFTRAYFVANNAQGQPALFRREVGGGGVTPQELVQGIEAMQFAFGLTAGGGNDAVPQNYLPADQVDPTAWPNVRSVRLGMLVRLETQTSADQGRTRQRYDMLGADDTLYAGSAFDNYPPNSVGDPEAFFNDRRQRHVYIQTVEKRKPIR
jgi:type IV pilus assembly protein PilW